ncbi:GxGYxYP domain-containing protein [Sphingobacterium sp. HJSM2_6]|uniref:GxGYxYP domain-containing protein n=1 Tax=Sphingobacterium sp. HJSM2_6 TaxID=3366264 RepID=UPI003BBBBDEB
MKVVNNFIFIWVVSMLINYQHGFAQSKNPIGIFDLGYTLEPDFNDKEKAKTAWDHTHFIASLQGVVNKKEPNLYIHLIKTGEVDIDRYWWSKYRKKNNWLANRDTIEFNNLESLVHFYKNHIKGAVVYDPLVASTSNVASAVAGSDNLVAIRFDLDPNSVYSKLVKSGPKIPVKVWLVEPNGKSIFKGKGIIPKTKRMSTGSAKNDAYIWYIENYFKKGKTNAEFGAYYIDQIWLNKPTAVGKNHHTLSNHDYFISKGAFFFDLSPWQDESATDDLTQPLGTDLNTLKEFLLLAYKQNENGKKFTHIGGFPPWAYKYTKHAGGKHEDVPTEWEYSRIISAYNAFKDADAIGFGALANASFWQHYPLKKEYPQKWVTDEELKSKGYLDEQGKLVDNGKDYYLFYVGDYDASSWLSQTTAWIWDDPNRGKVPLMWSISPILARRVPMAMEYRWESATANDYFAAADNGAGYLMPGMLQIPRPISNLPDATDQWAEHNIPFYKQWGMSITGFIIDGEAPGLNKAGMDAYAKFSPNGIVPQKVPLSLLYEEMPVLKSDEDVNQENPKDAATVIVNRIANRPIKFHWFRNILKTPTWYVQVVDEVKAKNPNAILLDAPTFFALYKKYLLENPTAARSDWFSK